MKYQVSQDPHALAEAEANSRKAIELDDHLAEPYVTLGKMHNTAGQHDLAVQEFQRALSLNPRNSAAIIGIGRANENAGRVAAAEASFRKAVDLSPNDWDAMNNLGAFYNRQHRYKEAINSYQQALRLAPDNAQILLNLGAAYINAADPASLKQAEPALLRSIELHPSYAAYANLGMLYYGQHRFGDAASALDKALTINGSDYNVWHDLRLSREWLNDAAGAKAAADREAPLLKAYIDTHPQDAIAEASFANLAARFGPKDEATPHLRRALALSPDDPNILESAASTYQNLGDREKALSYLKRAIEKKYPLTDLRDDPEVQSLLPAAGVS
jgi:serine/threonine-protein kinase